MVSSKTKSFSDQKEKFISSLTKRKEKKIHTRRKYMPEGCNGHHLHSFSIHKLFHNSPIQFFLNYGKDFFLVFREDSSIELWNNETVIRRVPGRPSAMIKKGVFIHGRLITVGLDGFIRIWSVPDFKIISQFPSNGGAIWDCCKVNHNEIAIACEDGKARIFKFIIPVLDQDSFELEDDRKQGRLGFSDISDNMDPVDIELGKDRDAYIDISIGSTSMESWDLELSKTFATSLMDSAPNRYIKYLRNVNRLLTIAVDHKKKILVCGGICGIYCFDLEATVLNFHIATEGLVWCLTKVGNDEFAFGDSEGSVSIFETTYGTIIQEFTRHNHDVTSIHLFKDVGSGGHSIVSVGIDGQLVVYSKNNSSLWNFRSSKRPSISDLHFITTLNAKPNVLILGGVDGQIIEYQIPLLSQMKKGAFYSARIDTVGDNILTSSKNQGIYAFHDYQKNIYIMYSPISTDKEISESKYFKRSFEYQPKIVLKIEFESQAGWNISSISMSPDAKYLAVSTLDAVELIELKHTKDEDKCEIISRKNLKKFGITPAHSLRFITIDTLAIATRDQTIEFFNIPNNEKFNIKLETNHSSLHSFFSNHENKVNGRLGSKVFNTCIQYIEGNERYFAVAYGHIISVYNFQNILDSYTKQRLNKAMNHQGQIEIIEPIHVIPFIYSTIVTIKISNSNLHVLGTGNIYSVFELKKGACQFKYGFIQFDLQGTKSNNNLESLSVSKLPNDIHVGGLKFIYILKKGNVLLATHKEGFLYNPSKNKITSILLDEEGTNTSVLALQSIGSKQFVACTVSNLHQVYELPKVVYRKRFGAL